MVRKIWIPSFVLAFLFNANFTFADEIEILHDNLPAVDAPAKAFYDYRPSLFGEAKRKVFVRRDKVNTDPNLNVTVSFLSGTGNSIFRTAASNEAKAEADLNAISFESVSGTAKYDRNVDKFKVRPDASVSTGVDFVGASSLAQIAAAIYLTFPDASRKFAAMGFTEQHFVAGLKSDAEGVVLKSKDAVVLAFRGTEPKSLADWMSDAKFAKVPLLKGEGPRVHLGFYQAASELWPLVRASIVSTLENKIRSRVAYLAKNPANAAKLASYGINGKVAAPDNRPIYLTGHSLGAAMATLIYGELTLNWMDHTNLGYYFIDPTLAAIPNSKINQLIADTIEDEKEIGPDEQPLFAKTTFSIDEEDSFLFAKESAFTEDAKKSAFLGYLGVIQNERAIAATPMGGLVDNATVDSRIRELVTFGCPRSGDWLYKYAVERYARVTGSLITRFENYHESAAVVGEELKADIVPRVPVGHGIFISEFTHVGTSVTFDTDEKNVMGNPEILNCAYTDKEHERKLSLYSIFTASPKFSVGYHNMGLYLDRVRSYADKQLGQNHSCNMLKYKTPE